MNAGGGGDREIERSSPGLSAALRYECMQSTALARCRCVEWQSVEVVLDEAEAPHPATTCLLVGSDEHPEMQLGQRDHADR